MAHERPAVFQDQARQNLQRVFESNLPPNGLHKVLDAGCGYKLPIDVPRGVRLSGIDNSQAMLEKNTNADELILGDIQSYPLPTNEYDAVICWWVLEHVPRPADALTNMSSSLAPGGLLVLGIPHIWSMKAFVTKLTPYRFHVWVLRHVYGIADAGKPGVEPMPTYLRHDLAPERVKEIVGRERLKPVYTVTHRSGAEASLPRPIRILWNAIAKVASVVTLGLWDPHSDEYVAIFQKEPQPA
jgi:SAM-dependent methyltransferase